MIAVGGDTGDVPVIMGLQSPAGDGAYLIVVDQGENYAGVYSTQETTFALSDSQEAKTYPQGWQNLTDGKINCFPVDKVSFIAEGWNGVVVGQ